MKAKFVGFDEDGNSKFKKTVEVNHCSADHPPVVEVILPNVKGGLRSVLIPVKELLSLIETPKPEWIDVTSHMEASLGCRSYFINRKTRELPFEVIPSKYAKESTTYEYKIEGGKFYRKSK